jgi:hypothetical protein
MLKEVLIVYYIPYWTLIIHPLFNEGTDSGEAAMSRFGKQCGHPTLF